MLETSQLFVERSPEPHFWDDVVPEEPAKRLQWEVWKRGGMESWAREFLRQRLGSIATVRRFLAMNQPQPQDQDRTPALRLYNAWLKGGRKALEAEYDQMYPPNSPNSPDPAKTSTGS
ncbi:MAG TPA: hypothetical protein VKV15_09365 [Bryobacteraceae bacterium]|nr:hypothetical protein [Bryobacteraceae bacterium]